MSAPLPVSSLPTVLVTGAAKRLGREIALALAAQGWRVAVHYRDSVEDATKTVADCASLTPGAAAFRANFGNEAAARNLLPAILEKFAHIDAVVNCASTFEHDTPANFSFSAVEKHMRSNAGAAIVLSEALHRHITQRRQVDGVSGAQPTGVVVNLLDQKLRNDNADFFSYTLSKSALEAATSMLSHALSPCVRVVGVEVLRSLSPLGRSSTAQEVAATVLAVLQDPRLTGTVAATTEPQSGFAKPRFPHA